MSANVVEAQIRIDASPDSIYQALTDEDALRAWFAEDASVDLDENRYEFSGRYVLGTPQPGDAGMKLREAELNRRLVYSWPLDDSDSVVAMQIESGSDGSLLKLEHHKLTGRMPWLVEAFWSMALENLRGYVERGEPGLRFDFANIPYGDVKCSTDVNADPDAVFDALINPAQLDRYMSETQATVEPEVGGVIDLGWSGEGPVKILDLAPGERLTYSWHSDKDDTVGNVVTWDLEGSAGRTTLTLVHSGFAPDRAGMDYGLGWLDYLNRIKQMVEGGARWEKPSIRVVDPRDIRGEGLYYPGVGIHDAVPTSRDLVSRQRAR